MFVDTGYGEVFRFGDLFDGHPVHEIHNRDLPCGFLLFFENVSQEVPGRILLLTVEKRGVVQDIQVFVQGMFFLVPYSVQTDIRGDPVQQGRGIIAGQAILIG